MADEDHPMPNLDPAVVEALAAQHNLISNQFSAQIDSLRATINDLQLALVTAQQPAPPAPPAPAPRTHRRLEGSPPSLFNGDRATGRVWLDQCLLYLTANNWDDDEHKIKHTLTFFKEGRALTWATEASQYLVSRGHYSWLNFEAFVRDFRAEFTDPHDTSRCVSMLSYSREWYQGSRTLDDYTDTFMDLVKRAGYVDSAGIPLPNLEVQVVLLFRTGLAPYIRQHLAVVLSPTPVTLADWKRSASKFVAAKAEDDVIQNATRLQSVPARAPLRPHAPPRAPAQRPAAAPVLVHSAPVTQPVARAPVAMPKGHGEPMDIDAVHRRHSAAALARIECYNCHKMGHLSRDCPETHTIRALDMDGNPILTAEELAQIDDYKNYLALEYDRDEILAAGLEDEPEDFGSRRM